MNKNHIKFSYNDRWRRESGIVRQEDMKKCLEGVHKSIRVIHKGFTTRSDWNDIKDSKGIQDAIDKFYPEHSI